MTLSKAALQANRHEALIIFIRQCNGFRCALTFFDTTKPEYADILPTTWKELVRSGCVRQHNEYIYQLTGAGWLEAMRVTGQIDDKLHADVGKIMGALKNRVRGRHHTAFAALRDVAVDAGVSEDLVFNVVESAFTKKVFRQRGACWHGHGKQIIEIPIDFGHDL